MHAPRARVPGICRVVAHVKAGNRASERVLERAGFTREGVSRSMPAAGGAWGANTQSGEARGSMRRR